jgi:EmrB/QacA subfamily drug resistance transporter
VTELSAARRRGILGICCMSLFIVGIDNTIVNVALPSIRTSLHASTSGLQWTVDAYTLVIASLLMLSGSTADRLGRKRIFQLGLVMFTAGSLLCSLAPGLGWLVAFRALQAVGGSMLNPVAMSIITNVFTDRRERATAIGIWGAVVGVSPALGPVIGGALVDTIGWRSIFWINIPVGIAAWLLTRAFIPESRAPHARRLDPPGQLLVMAALTALTASIIEGPRHGWTSPLIVTLFIVAALAVVGLVTWELHSREPLIDVRFFRSVPFAAATVIAVAAFMSLAGLLFLNTIYLQEVRRYDALTAGLYTLPLAGVTVLVSPISGRLVAGRGTRVPLVAAGIGIAGSGLILVGLSRTTPTWQLLLAYVVFGVGFGLVNAPITNTAVSGMPTSQAGVASAVASTSRQIGSTLGVALLGSLVVGRAHPPLAATFGAASHLGWWLLTALGVTIVVLGVLSTTRRAAASAAATAALLDPPEVGEDARGVAVSAA